MEVKQLLDNVEKIVRQNEELSALKGENFNIFQIFNLESDENKVHSRFIETLLNPKGKHGRGTIFLRLFLEELNIPDYFENVNNVWTQVEYQIGNVRIDGMNSTGGRIDILLWDDKKSISIENKIYASDQEKQIVRYWNYKKDTNTVFYLNLNGNEPSDSSKGDLKSNNDDNNEVPDFYCISYSETILNWLEKCQKESSDFPVIRETIKQYIITIKRITNQLTNLKMNDEIIQQIIGNYESARIIAANIDNAKIAIIDTFLDELVQSLKVDLEDDWGIERDGVREKWSKVKIAHKSWFKGAALTLGAEAYFWKNETILGLPCPRGAKIRQKLETSLTKNEFNAIRNNYPKESKAWFFYKPMFNFLDDNWFTKLLTEEARAKFIERLSFEIKDLAKELKLHLKDISKN